MGPRKVEDWATYKRFVSRRYWTPPEGDAPIPRYSANLLRNRALAYPIAAFVLAMLAIGLLVILR